MSRGAGTAPWSRMDHVLVLIIVVAVSATVGRLAGNWNDSERVPHGPTEVLNVAIDVPALTGSLLPESLVPEDGVEVLVIFMTHCGECQVSVPAWNDIADRGYRLLAVTGTISADARLFANRLAVGFPVVALEGNSGLDEFNGGVWTIVLGHGRQIRRAMRGALLNPEPILEALRATER